MKAITDKFKYKENCKVYGLTKELSTLYISNYFKTHDENVLILTNSLYEANNLYKSLSAYFNEVLFFPMDDFLTSVAIATSPDLQVKRLETLEKIKTESTKKHIIVTCLMGYLKYLPNIEEEQSFNINPSPQIISREIILQKLEEFGYKKDSLVTVTGEYAVRGFIIDIFPLQAEKPVRIEFFGDDIESIKEFDEETQLTTKELNSIDLKRFSENVNSTPNSLMDYLNNDTLFVIDELQIKNSYNSLQQDIFDYNTSKQKNDKYMFTMEEIKTSKTFFIDMINSYDDKSSLVYHSKEIENFNSNLELLKTYCEKENKKNTIIFAVHSDKQLNLIKNIFPEALPTNEDNIVINKINIIKKEINHGFIFENFIIIGPADIDKSLKKEIKYKNNIHVGRKVKSFNELSTGDFIVHEAYGIGVYKGLKTIKHGELIKDYIELEYSDNDKVYVPIDNIDKLYKYSSNGGQTPKLNKLNSGAWAKKKSETRKKIRDISGDLIELYRARKNVLGIPYKTFEEEELKFALSFPYNLTKDQEKTINEIDIDLKSSAPMDRLLCGDVGYGKTEVAFRAMFKAVINGYQVSYLCPTTILSKQQYNSALERFKDFPLRIELLNRHVSAKNVTRILKDLEDGKIDIIIGTHKLLNDKIKYKKLGLLIIDEEQRFGVTHKEKIKKIKNDVNVLTLSATPIPRTLKMAMSGLRSLSVLDTPPVNRYPIQTYVIEENELIIRDAIYKELTRGGQIFILINNVEELDKYKTKINKIVPEAKITIGHGQMSSDELNSIMEQFINGEHDILICTTIIETGIDIPNVNTIIVINSDHFGLSQLYQIRGRVGRSDKIAYAYLMYNPAKILTETATKRLDSIKEFTELGSGYKIAMRDLAIRGAGDLLGSEQAGFIDAVGLDLYTKMVDEEVGRLEGKEIPEEENNITLNVSTHISDAYVEDESIKIEIHKLINSIKNKVDFINVKEELENRFGTIGEEIEIYMLEKCTESLLKELQIENLIQLQKKITITIPEEISNKIDGEKLFLQSYNIYPKFDISYRNKKITISLNTDSLPKNYIYYIYELLNLITEMIK